MGLFLFIYSEMIRNQLEGITINASIKSTDITSRLGSLLVPADTGAKELPEHADLVSQFKERGVVLLRGFDLSKESFVKYTTALTPDFMDYSGGAYAREAIDGDETVLSVTGNKQFFAVPFHGEMFYTKFRPTVLWFYCVSPPVSGGETTTCDGVAVREKLSAATLKLFEQQDIKYVRSYDSATWKGIYLTSDLGRVAEVCAQRDTGFSHDPETDYIQTEYQCSAFTRPLYTDTPAFVNNILPVVLQEANGNTHSLVRFADGSKIPDDVVAEIREVTDQLTLPVAWESGDLIMVDNSRLMHGRNGFNDTQREINVRMSSTTF